MAARKRNSKKAIHRTKAAFKKEYLSLWTRLRKIPGDPWNYRNPEWVKLVNRLEDLQDAHPEWTVDIMMEEQKERSKKAPCQNGEKTGRSQGKTKKKVGRKENCKNRKENDCKKTKPPKHKIGHSIPKF